MMKHLSPFALLIILFAFVFFAFASAAAAQDISWQVMSKDDLVKNRGEFAKVLLAIPATPEVRKETEQKAIDLWKRSETDDDVLSLKMFAAKWLGKYGSEAAVPTLAAQLDNDNAAAGFYARYALENIPGSKTDEALIQALKTAKKPAAIAGILNTLGVRKEAKTEAKTAAAAKSFLTDGNAEVRKAAGYAYALTAAESAGTAVFGNAKMDPALADSAFLFAERLLKAGKSPRAAQIYDAIASANIKEYQQNAAIYQSILARGLSGVNGKNGLVDQLKSENGDRFDIGLKAGRELPASNTGLVTNAMITQLKQEKDPLRKAKILRAVCDRSDAESKAMALPVVIELAKSTEEPVRLAAIESMVPLGSASVLPVLIESAKQTEMPRVAEAAQNTLRNLTGKDTDEAIANIYKTGDSAGKVLAIELIRDRRLVSAYPAIREGVKSSDAAVKKAALDALGQTADVSDLPILFDVLRQAANDDDKKAALTVLKSACTRLPQDECSEQVNKVLSADTPAEMKLQLLDLLMEIAGQKAVDIVTGYAWGNDAALQDKATALLGEWRSQKDIDLIAAACKKLAAESKEERYRIRGLRAYIRLARQFNMPEDRKIQICREVFEFAGRDEDRILVFDVYNRNPTLNMLNETAKHITAESPFKEKASEAAVIIGEKLQGKNPRTAEVMKMVIAVSGTDSVKERAQRVAEKQ